MTAFDATFSSPSRLPPPASFEEGLRLVQAGNIEAAKSVFARLVALNPHHTSAFKNLGFLTIQSGDVPGGASILERAYQMNPDDDGIRTGYIQAHLFAAGHLNRQGNPGDAIRSLRKVLALDPANDGARIELTTCLARTGAPAVPGDYLPDPKIALGRHALIACMPKSGSTLLFETMCALTGWQKAYFSYAFLQNEQELYLPALQALAATDTVTQQHCRATEPNIQLLQGFGITPVILIRNLFDIVMSLADFYDKGAVANTFFSGHWADLGPEEKRDNIIDHVMPWYLGFFASWQSAIEGRRLNCLVVRYEDMIDDKPATLLSVMELLGLDSTPGACEAAFRAVEGDPSGMTRLNRGVAGRGEDTLTAGQKDRLRRLSDSYRKIDFSPVGL